MDQSLMDVDGSQHAIPESTNHPRATVNPPPLSVSEPNLPAGEASVREPFRNLSVKVHIRKAGRVAWKYVGRAHVVQEFSGHMSRVVVKSVSTGKVLITFSELSDVSADKRGSFIVVACVGPEGITSWSLNTINNSDALKLLASIELACYRCKQAVSDPTRYKNIRRKIEKLVRDDRRKRHDFKRQEDELVSAFGQQTLAEGA